MNSRHYEKYFGGDRPEMLKFIPSAARYILDVGCGKGKFGAILQKKGCEVWGVELDASAAEEASKKLFRVVHGNITSNLDLPENYFDCIVFNDVLEHLVDPWEILSHIKQYLVKESGIIVASLPNVRQIYNIYQLLLKKDWQYHDSGILDKTHFRFFTQKSIKRFFKDCDYELLRMEGIDPFKNIFFELLNFLCLRAINDMKYLRFACVAKPCNY